MASQYLRPDVALEPTVNRWHAWSHLVAPHTAALHLARTQLSILDSFVRSPDVHRAALRDPRMRGGPFLDLAPERVDDVAALADELRGTQARAVEFAAAVAELEARLADEGNGSSLEPLYARVPEPLRGYVELVYDTAHRPGYRFFERLLYRSPLYDPGAQRLVLQHLTGDERAFVLSTPRFANDPDVLEVERPFDDAGVARLLRARDEAVDPAELAEALGLAGGRAERLATFFQEDAPAAREPWAGERPRVRYLGHACVLLESRSTSVLTDPLIGYRSAAEPFRYGFDDLPERIDWVVITHGHQDHVVLESLLPLRHRIGTVVVPRSNGGFLEDPSLRLALEAVGFERVVELDELEQLEIDGGRILGLPFLGEHGDLRVRAKLAYLVELGGVSCVFAADSNNLEPRLYEHVREIAGPVDELFLGMECDGAPQSWLYGSLLGSPLKRSQDRSRRLCGSDCERGLALIERLQPARVWVYAMGQEPWCGFITSIGYDAESLPIVESDRLVAACVERGLPAQRLYGAHDLPPG